MSDAYVMRQSDKEHSPSVYLEKMDEIQMRLSACEHFLMSSSASRSLFEFESAVLQLRKTMEAIAFAAIAPNKEQYAAVRKNAEKSADFRSDWKADSIFLILEKLNPDFYPDPLLEPTKVREGHWHFERLQDGYMKRKSFETLYKRLGKFLHADNPWGSDKGWKQLESELPAAIGQLRALLKKHRTMIRADEFKGVWIVDAPSDGTPARMVQAEAQGDFSVSKVR